MLLVQRFTPRDKRSIKARAVATAMDEPRHPPRQRRGSLLSSLDEHPVARSHRPARRRKQGSPALAFASSAGTSTVAPVTLAGDEQERK
jgi:hypothetical protein